MKRWTDGLKTSVILTLAGLFGSASWVHAETTHPEAGLVRVLVQDEWGIPAPSARVYVNSKNRVYCIVESDRSGWVWLNLQPGSYSISSTLNKPEADFIDRYASAHADVKVTPEESTSVVLILHQLEDSVSNLSPTALKKMGVADEVAKYINN